MFNIFKKNCSNVFRIRQDPLSESYIQYLNKITANGSTVQDLLRALPVLWWYNRILICNVCVCCTD
jgi:thiaminase